MSTRTLEKTDTTGKIEEALNHFIDAVSLTDDLELIGTTLPADAKEAFVIRDHSKAENIEGAYVEVSITEIIKHIMAGCHMPNAAEEKAQEIISVIRNERKGVVLEGVTRIVGYYSRVKNWNQSKVGELRDRASGSYGLTGKVAEHQTERLKTINSL